MLLGSGAKVRGSISRSPLKAARTTSPTPRRSRDALRGNSRMRGRCASYAWRSPSRPRVSGDRVVLQALERLARRGAENPGMEGSPQTLTVSKVCTAAVSSGESVRCGNWRTRTRPGRKAPKVKYRVRAYSPGIPGRLEPGCAERLGRSGSAEHSRAVADSPCHVSRYRSRLIGSTGGAGLGPRGTRG